MVHLSSLHLLILIGPIPKMFLEKNWNVESKILQQKQVRCIVNGCLKRVLRLWPFEHAFVLCQGVAECQRCRSMKKIKLKP